MSITPFIEAPAIRTRPQPVSGGINISSYEHLLQGVEVKNIKNRSKGSLPKIGAGTIDHTIEQVIFGQSSDYPFGLSFNDTKQKIYAQDYLENRIQYNSASLDEGFSTDGVIEPLDIRKVIKGTTVGITAHVTNGTLAQGNTNKFNASDTVSNFILVPQVSGPIPSPFIDNGSHVGSNIQYSVIIDGDRTNLKTVISAFNEQDINSFRTVSDSDTLDSAGNLSSIDNALLFMTGAVDDSLIPHNHKSANAGFVYNTNYAGTDSLAFGGFLHPPSEVPMVDSGWGSLWGTPWGYQSSGELLTQTKIKLLPREEIRYEDNFIPHYPTIARTGDERTGKYPVRFNDVETIIYNNQTVVYPNLFGITSPHFNSYLTSSIEVSTAIKPGVTDKFARITRQSQSLSPYNEAFRPEQSVETDFFLTGTSNNIALDFTEKLASKTQIKYQLPIASRTTILANTASIMYFNTELGRFEVVAQSQLTNPSNGVIDTFGSYDSRLFGPFGNNVVSGNLSNPASLVPSLFVSIALAQTSSVLNLPAYSMTSSNYFDLNINHPFILESVVIELPISFSVGWSRDKTTFIFDDEPGSADYVDYGGPAVTVALLRQDSSNSRELIVSGTFIPIGDNFYDVYSPISSSLLSPQGFLSFGTPNAIVSGTGGIQKILLTIKPAVSNGFFAYGSDNQLGRSAILQINNFGRGAKNKASGRSLFGGEFVLSNPATHTSIQDRLEEEGLTIPGGTQVYLFAFEGHRESPYLLLPDDKLTVSISKHRSIATNPSSSFSILSSSHEISIETGSLNVTMYGSLIRDRLPFHDSQNPPLVTLSINEPLHSDNPVVDQYDVENLEVLAGSYIDNIVGVITNGVNNAFEYLSRGVKGSAVGNHIQTGVTGSLLRGVRSISSERYFDSAPPEITGLVSRGGGTVIGLGTRNSGGTITPSSECIVQFGPGTAFSDTSIDKTWHKAFPFEPLYAGISRSKETIEDGSSVKKHGKFKATRIFASPSGAGAVGVITSSNKTFASFSPAFTAMFDSITDGGSAPYTNKIKLERNPLTASHVRYVADRAMFGFGDAVITGSDSSDSNIHMPKMVASSNNVVTASQVELHTYRDCKIRGWKYGLINAIPYYSTAVFRYDHFGFFSDMLEQRKDSKFFDEMGIVSSPIKVTFSTVDGELSFSSNLSLEATSSLPYFDGESRNRGELPEVEFVKGE